MKKLLSSFVLLLAVTSGFAQPLPCPPSNTTQSASSGDTTVCDGGCATIYAQGSTTLRSTSSYSISTIPYLPQPYDIGTSVLVNIDDQYSPVVPIPFDFCFYGIKYNSCVIGANGELSFNNAAANGPCPWEIDGPLPANTNVATINSIMAPYYDMDPSKGGTTKWAVYGTAPCRTFVVSWNDIPLYWCNNLIATHQVVLYESTYAIDIFIKSRPICTQWNGGLGTLGLEDATGTQVAIAANRNATQWSATDEGWRFTPSGPPTWKFNWFDPAGNPIGNNQAVGDVGNTTVTVCPTVESVYKVKAVASSDCDSLVYWDSVIVRIGKGPVMDSFAVKNPTGCGFQDGKIIMKGTPPNLYYNVTFTKDGILQPAVMVLANNDSVITVPGLGAGVYDSIVVITIPGCKSDKYGPLTLVDPVLTVSSTVGNPPSICGEDDGSIVMSGVTADSVYSVNYTLNGQPQPPISLTADAAGNLTMFNLVGGNYSITLYYRGCSTTVNTQVVDPPFNASYTFDIHLGCVADTVVFHNSSVGGFFFGWNFGDGSPIDTNKNPTHIFTTHAAFNVMLYSTNKHCVDTSIQLVDVSHPLSAMYTTDHDSVCQHNAVAFTFTGTSVPPTTYWFSYGDGSTDASGTPPPHVYDYMGIYITQMAVTDYLGCHDTVRKPIVVDTTPYAFIRVTDTAICVGEKISFDAIFSERGSTGLTWVFSDSITIRDQWPVIHSFDTAGKYFVRLNISYSYCPDTNTTIPIKVSPFPIVNLGPDTSMCPNAEQILLADHINVGNPNAKWLWNTGDKTSYLHVTEDGVYSTTVTLDGCSNSDTVWVKKDCYLDIPNSFTPNGDGLNDYFFPRQFLSGGLTTFKMSIFNRWGNEIWNTKKIDGRGWDGRYNNDMQPTGVYIYIIDITLKDGRSQHYQGNVTLLK